MPTPNDIRRNVAEWRSEVEARVALAVANTLRNGRHPSEADMRLLGAEGRHVYYERLPKAALKDAPAAVDMKSTRDIIVKTADSKDYSRPTVIKKILLNEIDWRASQSRRASYTWRASEECLWLMLLLIAAATLVFLVVPNQGIFSRFARLLEVL
jgi:hypothetical protein